MCARNPSSNLHLHSCVQDIHRQFCHSSVCDSLWRNPSSMFTLEFVYARNPSAILWWKCTVLVVEFVCYRHPSRILPFQTNRRHKNMCARNPSTFCIRIRVLKISSAHLQFLYWNSNIRGIHRRFCNGSVQRSPPFAHRLSCTNNITSKTIYKKKSESQSTGKRSCSWRHKHNALKLDTKQTQLRSKKIYKSKSVSQGPLQR